jgi:hypothetical protein
VYLPYGVPSLFPPVSRRYVGELRPAPHGGIFPKRCMVEGII